ncbi:MAG: hypothetical protein ACI8PT_004494, partial [Gammaproteobacteria bacterium]
NRHRAAHVPTYGVCEPWSTKLNPFSPSTKLLDI